MHDCVYFCNCAQLQMIYPPELLRVSQNSFNHKDWLCFLVLNNITDTLLGTSEQVVQWIYMCKNLMACTQIKGISVHPMDWCILPPLHSSCRCCRAPPRVVWGMLWQLVADFRNQYSCFVLSLSVHLFVPPSICLSVCLFTNFFSLKYLVWAGFALSYLSFFPTLFNF